MTNEKLQLNQKPPGSLVVIFYMFVLFYLSYIHFFCYLLEMVHGLGPPSHQRQERGRGKLPGLQLSL